MFPAPRFGKSWFYSVDFGGLKFWLALWDNFGWPQEDLLRCRFKVRFKSNCSDWMRCFFSDVILIDHSFLWNVVIRAFACVFMRYENTKRKHVQMFLYNSDRWITFYIRSIIMPFERAGYPTISIFVRILVRRKLIWKQYWRAHYSWTCSWISLFNNIYIELRHTCSCRLEVSSQEVSD